MVTFQSITDPDWWEKYILSRPESNFLQSYYHGLTHQQIGKKVFYPAGIRNKKIQLAGLAILEEAKRGRYLTVPGGPIGDWQNIDLIKSYLRQLIEIGKKERCVFIRLRPQILDTLENRQLANKLNLRVSPMHLTAEHTLQLDLRQPLETILARMRKTTRYEIRRAEKMGIEVTGTTDLKAVTDFYQLQLATAQRHDFVPFSQALIEAEFHQFALHNQAVLYTASFNKEILAQSIVIHYPTESSYHFGASTEAGRKFPGAYLIQWQAIQDSQKRGIPRYNFWGIVAENQTSHRFYGVSVFKRGFGGQEVKYLPSHDLVIDKIKYSGVFLLETLRRKLRRLDL